MDKPLRASKTTATGLVPAGLQSTLNCLDGLIGKKWQQKYEGKSEKDQNAKNKATGRGSNGFSFPSAPSLQAGGPRARKRRFQMEGL